MKLTTEDGKEYEAERDDARFELWRLRPITRTVTIGGGHHRIVRYGSVSVSDAITAAGGSGGASGWGKSNLMPTFESNRLTLARELPEMRYHCSTCSGTGTDTGSFAHVRPCPVCQERGYVPLPISGDGTRSWMAVLILALNKAHVSKVEYSLLLMVDETGQIIADDNPDEALAAAAVKALEVRHGSV